MAKKPTLKKGPAAQFEGPNEIIREFGDGKGKGGLISLAVMEDGTLRVELYQADENVRVSVSKELGMRLRVQTSASRNERWVQDDTLFWVSTTGNYLLYSWPAPDSEPTLIGPGGSVGGDVQASEAYSVSFQHATLPGRRIDVNFYAAQNDGEQDYFVQRQIMCGITEEGGDGIADGPIDYHDTEWRYDTLREAIKAAYEMAASYSADDIAWDGITV